MLKVAILDDYQNVSQEFLDLKKLSKKYEIKVFNDPFIDENDAIDQLKEFQALLIMRERTQITSGLIDALKNNIIAGAGLDVYDKEPLPQDHKLRFLPNALLLPHLGYVTKENYDIFYFQMMENLESCIAGKPIRVIN